MVQRVKIAVNMYNQCTNFRTDVMSQFRLLVRSASFTSYKQSQETLLPRFSQHFTCVPHNVNHTQTAFKNTRLLYPTYGICSRFMSSRPPFHEDHHVAVSLNDEERLTLVKAEYELYKAEGEVEVPSQITEKHLFELAKLNSIMTRKRYLRYLFLTEKKILNDKQKSIEKRNYANERHRKLMAEEKTEESYLQYGLWRNTTFIKWSKQHMKSIDSHRIIQARLYGQPIVFDFDFDNYMGQKEKKFLGKQIAACIGMNRDHREPFYFHMCNFREEEDSAKVLLSNVPTLLNDDYLVDVHSEDYLDVFPKDKLVYLTPHTREEMKGFDHDAVYIIGGFVDMRCSEPITLAKAKRQNIKMQKLPLDRYLDWGHGKKSLALNQVLGIMLELKQSGSFVEAFRKNIPPRKLIKINEPDPDAIRKKIRGLNHSSQATGKLVRSLFKD